MAKSEIIRIKEGVVEFKLLNKPKYACLMDLEDYQRLVEGSSSWHIHTGKKSIPYIRRYNGVRQKHLHREVLREGDFTKDRVVEHKNKNGLDNRKKNLEVVTFSENNRRAHFSNRDSRVGQYYKNILINKIVNRGGYQAYDNFFLKKKYVGFSTTLKGIKKKIDDYVEKQGISYE